MRSSAEIMLEEDLASAAFLAGAHRGNWGLPDPSVLPDACAWPRFIVWVRPASRPKAPERFYFDLDMTGYRGKPPTGTLWDAAKQAVLALELRPKGRPGSRVAKVFRTDWNNAALYHPYDRVAADSHPEWLAAHPNLIWTPQHTMVDYVMEMHGLLNGDCYVGV